MIDIHTHVIFGVDDGAKDIEESITLITREILMGVTDIICTPHSSKLHYNKSKEEIEKNFSILKEEVNKRGLKINLYLGSEINYHSNTIRRLQNNEKLTMNYSKYCLLEFPYIEETDIEEAVYGVTTLSLIPILAHVERYLYLTIDDIKQLVAMNALIQVNAESIVGGLGFKIQRKVFKLIKEGLVDFVASDCHYHRKDYLSKAYEIVTKRFGQQVANDLFKNNAEMLIKEKREIA